MKNILNLYNYKVEFDRVDENNIRIIFTNSLAYYADYSKYIKMDIMSLCLALNKEFNISKIDRIDDPSEDLYGMYIIVDKNLGYKILKTFLDNTNDENENERLDRKYADKDKELYSGPLYGDKCFSNYLESFKKELYNYSEICKKKITLPILNLYDKMVEWTINENNETTITIRYNPDCPINVEYYGEKFNIVELCVELNRRFDIWHGSSSLLIDQNKEYIAGIEIAIKYPEVVYRLLKTFLDYTNIKLLDDVCLIKDKAQAEDFKVRIYDKYVKNLEEFKNKMLKENK